MTSLAVKPIMAMSINVPIKRIEIPASNLNIYRANEINSSRNDIDGEYHFS